MFGSAPLWQIEAERFFHFIQNSEASYLHCYR